MNETDFTTHIWFGEQQGSIMPLTMRILSNFKKCGVNGCTIKVQILNNPNQKIWWLKDNDVVLIKLDIYEKDLYSDELYKHKYIRDNLNDKNIVVNQYGLFWGSLSNIPETLLSSFLYDQKLNITNTDKYFCLFQIMEYFNGGSVFDEYERLNTNVLRIKTELEDVAYKSGNQSNLPHVVIMKQNIIKRYNQANHLVNRLRRNTCSIIQQRS